MGKTTFISFSGLGIDEFKIRNVAFSVFGHDIMWYGIIITFGIILAYLYVNYRAKHNENISEDDVLDYAIFVVIFGIIGARLYYVFTKFSEYKDASILKTLRNMIAIWEGGLAIYGGIIVGSITLIVVSKIKKIKVGKAFDMIGPAVMLGQLIGRWGNFFNAEAFGRETDLPWRMGLRDEAGISAIYVHPTFLYESLWNLIGFIIINLLYKKKKFDGQVFLMYITWYGFGRMFIEGLRTDSLYVGDFRISQVIGFLCFFFGSALLISLLIVNRKPKEAIAEEKPEKTAVSVTETASAGTAEATENTAKAAEPVSSESEETPEKSDSANGGFEISADYADDSDDE